MDQIGASCGCVIQEILKEVNGQPVYMLRAPYDSPARFLGVNFFVTSRRERS